MNILKYFLSHRNKQHPTGIDNNLKVVLNQPAVTNTNFKHIIRFLFEISSYSSFGISHRLGRTGNQSIPRKRITVGARPSSFSCLPTRKLSMGKKSCHQFSQFYLLSPADEKFHESVCFFFYFEDTQKNKGGYYPYPQFNRQLAGRFCRQVI